MDKTNDQGFSLLSGKKTPQKNATSRFELYLAGLYGRIILVHAYRSLTL